MSMHTFLTLVSVASMVSVSYAVDTLMEMNTNTRLWIEHKSYDYEKNDFMFSDVQTLRMEIDAQREEFDSDYIRSTNVTELATNGPEGRYSVFDYPTKEALDFMTSMGAFCHEQYLGPPIPYKQPFTFHYQQKGKIRSFATKQIRENEIWCTLPHDRTDTSPDDDELHYGSSQEKLHELVTRLLQEMSAQVESRKSEVLETWDAIANRGILYTNHSHPNRPEETCEDIGWESPSSQDCELDSDMMRWWQYRETQPFKYECNGVRQYFKNDDWVIYADLIEDDIRAFSKTDKWLINEFFDKDVHGLRETWHSPYSHNEPVMLDLNFGLKYRANVNLKSFYEFEREIRDLVVAIPDVLGFEFTGSNLFSVLNAALCGKDSNTDCNWKRFYIPFKYVDHFTSKSPADAFQKLCKRDLRNKDMPLAVTEVWEYNHMHDTILKAQVAFRTWAQYNCNSDNTHMCMLGAKDMRKEDKGLAIPLILKPIDVGYSYYKLDSDGFTLVYVPETKMTYCYFVKKEWAVLGGVKVGFSPLSFSAVPGKIGDAIKGKAKSLAKAMKEKAQKAYMWSRSGRRKSRGGHSKVAKFPSAGRDDGRIARGFRYVKKTLFSSKSVKVKKIKKRDRSSFSALKMKDEFLDWVQRKRESASEKVSELIDGFYRRVLRNERKANLRKYERNLIQDIDFEIQHSVRKGWTTDDWLILYNEGYNPNELKKGLRREQIRQLGTCKGKLCDPNLKGFTLDDLGHNSRAKMYIKNMRMKDLKEQRRKANEAMRESIKTSKDLRAEYRRNNKEMWSQYQSYVNKNYPRGCVRCAVFNALKKGVEYLMGVHKSGKMKHAARGWRAFKRNPQVKKAIKKLKKKIEKKIKKALVKEGEGEEEIDLEEELKKSNPYYVNYWYEQGYCAYKPCTIEARFTGNPFSSPDAIYTSGKPGKTTWVQVSAEISFIDTGVKVNFFSTVSFGWNRLIRNIETRVYQPTFTDLAFIAMGGVSGFAAELIVTVELGAGTGQLALRKQNINNRIRYNTLGDVSLNPSTIRVTVCDTKNFREVEYNDMLFRPSLMSCELDPFQDTKMKLNMPPNEVFVKCPLTHYFSYATKRCVRYENGYKPSVMVHEQFLMGRVGSCQEDPCKIQFDESVLFSPYSALSPDVSYIDFGITEPVRVTESFMVGIEDIGLRNKDDNPYTDSFAARGPIAIVSDETCEAYGLTTIFAMTDPVNKHVQSYVEKLFSDNHVVYVDRLFITEENADGIPVEQENTDYLVINDESDNLFHETKILFGNDKITLEDRVKADNDLDFDYATQKLKVFKHGYIPYGTSIVPYKNMQENNKLYVVQKEKGGYGVYYEQFYGRPSGSSPVCTSEYKCICFKGGEYKYALYGEWDKAHEEEGYVYTYQPVQYIGECKVAIAAITHNMGFNDMIGFDDKMKDLDKPELRVVRDDVLFGCKRVNNVFQFNDKAYSTGEYVYSIDHKNTPTPTSVVSDSIVKIVRAKVNPPKLSAITSEDVCKRVAKQNGYVLGNATNAFDDPPEDIKGCHGYTLDTGAHTAFFGLNGTLEAQSTMLQFPAVRIRASTYENGDIKTNIEFKTVEESFISLEEKDSIIVDPPGLFAYSSGQAIIPRETGFTPIKFRPKDMDGDIYYHKIDGAAVNTIRYMRVGETYSTNNDGVYEIISNEGILNDGEQGEQDRLRLLIVDAAPLTLVNLPQVLEREVGGVENLLRHPFQGVSDYRKNSKPVFGDVDGDGDLDLLVADETSSRHYYEQIEDEFRLHSADSGPFRNIDLGQSSIPHFADLDGDGAIDLLVADGTEVRWYKNPNTKTALFIPGDNRFENISDATSVAFVNDIYYFSTAASNAIVCKAYTDNALTDTTCDHVHGKFGHVVSFNNQLGIVGAQLEVYVNSQWKVYPEISGHVAYFRNDKLLTGKENSVDYVDVNGNAISFEEANSVLLDEMDLFFEGKLTGIAVNIHLPVIPCRALASIEGQSYYIDKEGEVQEIPSYNLSYPLTDDGVQHRVCGHLPATPVEHSKDCFDSHSFPSQCPEGYGLVFSQYNYQTNEYEFPDDGDIKFLRQDLPQCVPCPEGTESPDGHARCLGKEFTIARGEEATISLFQDDYLPYAFPTHLQKFHLQNSDAYHPRIRHFNNMQFIDNEIYSDTKFLVCEDGYVPKSRVVNTPSVTNVQEVFDVYKKTCSGYTCERCPDAFVEHYQRCVPCAPGHIAGWAYNRALNVDMHDNNTCVLIQSPMGHFQDVQNPVGVVVDGSHYPYATHCDHWLYHPAGGIGAYQNETNQIECKTARRGFPATYSGRVVQTPNDPGQRVSNDRTQAMDCLDHQVCDGEQIVGCAPRYIWYRQTIDREDEECSLCNQDSEVLALHDETDNYEFCDGTHRFQCADASYTNADVSDDFYVGVRPTWTASNLARFVPQTKVSVAIEQNVQYTYQNSWIIEHIRTQERYHEKNTSNVPVEVTAVAIRGDVVASGEYVVNEFRHVMCIYNKITGARVCVNGHTSQINAVHISPDKTRVASASTDGTVKMWNIHGTMLWSASAHEDGNTQNYVDGAYQPNYAEKKHVHDVQFSPDGSKIVSVGLDKTLRFYKTSTGELLKTYTDEDSVHAVAWVEDNVIYSGGVSKKLQQWNYDSDENQALETVSDTVTSIDAASGTLAIACWNNIYIGTPNSLIRVPVGETDTVAVSADGQYVATSGYRSTIKVFDTAGRLHKTLGVPSNTKQANGHLCVRRSFGHCDPTVLAWGDVIVSAYTKIIMWDKWDNPSVTQVRLEALAWDKHTRCLPVPDGHFALDKKWKKQDCGYARHKCVHRTFHQIYPFLHPSDTAVKYMFTKAVRETSYDEIFRFSSRQCADGHLQDGCLKEYCTINGQTNCWCGEEEDFCTMACVDGMCLPSCGDQVCDPDYEMCFGLGEGAQCATKCTGPIDNYCVTDRVDVITGRTSVRYCRHYNTDWNSTKMKSLDPVPDSPCFSEMPNIPETQCKDIFDQQCFCNRDFLDDIHKACKDRKIVHSCSIRQDDNTCTYMTESPCLCGDMLTDGPCYQVENQCGPYASVVQNCSAVLETIKNKRVSSVPSSCKPTGAELLVQSERCKFADSIEKVYQGSLGNLQEQFKCVGERITEETGCMDPQGSNFNKYAVIPKKCVY